MSDVTEEMGDRELSILVWERVFGEVVCRDENCEGCDAMIAENAPDLDGNLMLRVVAAMEQRGKRLSVSAYRGGKGSARFGVPLSGFFDGAHEFAGTMDLPRAVAVAALRALDAEAKS